LVLCHQNFNHTKTKQPDLWHFNGETSDSRCGEYVFKEPTTKSIRPKQTRYWEYPARDGSRLVRVVRSDDGEGNKKISQERWDKDKKRWIPGYGRDEDVNKVARASIPIYRRAEVREAITKGEPIHIVEGEPCADLLWKLGLAATTNIGGGGQFTLADSMDLQGAELIVIVPDRDKKGIEHAEKVAEHFPQALWLYPFPLSKVWENLPEDHGLDIADWIEHEKLSEAELRDVIGEKKVFNARSQAATKVVSHPRFEAPNISNMKSEVRELVEQNLKRSDLTVAIAALSQKYSRQPQEIRSLYQELEDEVEQEAQKEDTRIGVEQLLASKAASVKLSDIFPESLAAPIEIVAKRMNLKPECYALALICGSSRFIKNGSSTMLVEEWNRYRCRTSGYFGALIAESAQMKTPVLNAIITDPLAAMRARCKEKFEAEKKAYTEELERWRNSKDENKGPMRDAPVEKFAYITKATWEGIAGMVGKSPTQGILWLCDELAGFFSSQNQYRSGRGSDKEDLLEAWSGNGAVIARAAGTTVNVGAVSLSLYGNIQPKILAPLLGDGNDDNGTFARFDFVQQPPALTQITLGLPSIDITPMLQALYEKMDANPVMEFELDEEAKKLFVDYYNHCQRLKFDHPKQGMRAMLGKAAEKAGRVATILHCIHAAHSGSEVSLKIPAQQIVAAIKWVEYTTQQALSINIEVSSPDAIESNLAKIISLAERKGGSVSGRDVLLSFDSKYRPTSQKVREWFGELEAMKYGDTTEKGRSIRFSLAKTSTSSTLAQNVDTVSVTGVEYTIHSVSTPSTLMEEKHKIIGNTVEDCGGSVDVNLHTFKTSSDMDLKLSVEDVEVFTPCLEISKPSESEHTTKPSNLNSAAKERTFDPGDRVVIKDVGGRYQGTKGKVVDVLYSRAGRSYLVKFDKRVGNVQQLEVEPSDLMKL
jgi:CRISPR-associated protein Cmr3